MSAIIVTASCRQHARARSSRSRSAPLPTGVRVVGAALVLLTLLSFLGAGCIGKSRFDGADAATLVATSQDSEAIARLQGSWSGQAEIGSDSIPETIEFYQSTTSVIVAAERSPVAVFDALDSGDDWVRIIVKHPTHVAVTTVRFLDSDRFWLEHYPNTIYTREEQSQPTLQSPANPRDQ